MVRLLARVAIGVLAFSSVLILIRLLGGLGPSPAAAILGPNTLRRPQPCWYDICPGETSLLQAENLLQADNGRISNIQHHIDNGYADTIDLYWEVQLDPMWQAGAFGYLSSETQDAIVDSLALGQRYKVVRLGDMITLLGDPLYSGEMCAENTLIDDLPGYGIVVGLAFKGDIYVAVYKPLSNIYKKDGWRISPDMVVFYVLYEKVSPDAPLLEPRWRGFTAWKGQYHACGFLPRFPRSP
jgi:hypothetical protein